MNDTMPTPRTDLFLACVDGDSRLVNPSRATDFARQLERELAVAIEGLISIAAPTWGEGKHPKLAEDTIDRVNAMRRKWEENK
jgi:hypothetical protein